MAVLNVQKKPSSKIFIADPTLTVKQENFLLRKQMNVFNVN